MDAAKTRVESPGVLSAGGVLDRIVEGKAARLAVAKSAEPFGRLIERWSGIGEKTRERSFAARLSKLDRINIIAEIKHRSPSKGIIRENFDPEAIAGSYARSGAAALSVLTEEDFFGGSLNHLKRVRGSVDLPLLRKDFIFDEYQVYETAAAGADALLLIVAILDDHLLASLIALANEVGLDALVEIHTKQELDRAVSAGALIVGVNNRDLTTFNVDISTSIELSAHAFGRALLVSESGIATGADVRRLRSRGFDAFLVGEHFMRREDPGEALAELLAGASSESVP